LLKKNNERKKGIGKDAGNRVTFVTREVVDCEAKVAVGNLR